MTTCQSVIDRLQELGSERTAATYKRHGAVLESYGVSFADFKKLKKELKKNQPLAEELWAVEILDARILATMITDPKLASEAVIDQWASELQDHMIADAFAVNFVANTPYARAKMEAWTPSENEWLGCAGWRLMSLIAVNDTKLDDAYFEPFLAEIETNIHTQKNRKKEAMHNALIALGMRNDALEARVFAIAKQIGYVDIDHGDTACKTPDVIEYVQKAKARKLAKAAR